MDLNEVRFEAPITQYLMNKAGSRCVPLSGTFELSPVCNFTCRMCYVRKTPQEVKAHSRPLMTVSQWLEIARQARDEGMLYLLLTGGEPFLWPDFWELYESLIRMGFLISINSNGSLIDDEVIQRLKKNPPTRINITLYGASDETYEALCQAKGMFSRVDRAICGLREAGIQVKLNCSLTPLNAHDLEKMNAYAVEHDLLFDAAAYMFPPVRRAPDMVGQNERFTPGEAAKYHLKRYQLWFGQEKYEQMLRQISQGDGLPLGLDESCVDPLDGKIRCRAGKAAFWITWDGWMTPCGLMPEPKVDISGCDFAAAWREIARQSDALVSSGTCAKCSDRGTCHACTAMAIAETGSPAGIPKYLCQMVVEMKRLAAAELENPDK